MATEPQSRRTILASAASVRASYLTTEWSRFQSTNYSSIIRRFTNNNNVLTAVIAQPARHATITQPRVLSKRSSHKSLELFDPISRSLTTLCMACLTSSPSLQPLSACPCPLSLASPPDMTVSLTPPPLDECKDAATHIKLEPTQLSSSSSSTFTPLPNLSPASTRQQIYTAIDSLTSFHSHHSHFHPAPEWDKLYACVRSYKKSHPDIPDIATAYQHHRRQVLGILSEEERTPSIDRHRKRRDRQQQSEKARRQKRTATTAVVVPPLTADLSASVALSSFHSPPPVSESASRCGCGAMVDANRRLQEELRRKDAQIAALHHKLTQMRHILDGDEVERKEATPSGGSTATDGSVASSTQSSALSPYNGLLAGGVSGVAGTGEWPEFYPSLWPSSGDVQCSNCTCCSWKLD